jgi:hypothetical protein
MRDFFQASDGKLYGLVMGNLHNTLLIRILTGTSSTNIVMLPDHQITLLGEWLPGHVIGH